MNRWQALRPALAILASQRRAMVLGSLLLLLTALSGIGLLALAGWFITATGVTALLVAAGTAAQLNIYAPGAGIRAFALIRTASRYFERVQNHDAVLRLLASARSLVFSGLATQPLEQLNQLHSGVRLNRLTADVDSLDQLYLRCLAPTLVALLSLGLIGLLLGIWQPWLGLALVLALLPAMTGLALLGDHHGTRLGEALVRSRERTRQQLIESVQGLPELRASGAWPEHQQQLAGRLARLQRTQTRTLRGAASAEALAGWLVQIAAVAVLGAALWLYQQDLVSAAVATLMPLAVMGLAEVLTPVPAAFVRLGQARAATGRLAPFLEAGSRADPQTTAGQQPTAELVPAFTDQADSTRHTPAGHPAEPPPSLQIEQLTLIHPGRLGPVMREFSLQVEPGEHVALIGPSGCGKSSLADACATLLPPAAGRILLDGTAVDQLPETRRFSLLGYLRQQTELFDASIRSNLLLAAPTAAPDRLWWALERVALAEHVAGLPEGLETWIGEHGMRLSGGQARRLALARLLLQAPTMVVLDEPLAGLDAATASIVAANLEQWLRGRTALLLAHAPEALPAVDRVLPFPHP